jgi:hypothetical protein
MTRRIIAASLWGIAFWVVLNVVVFFAVAIFVRSCASSAQAAESIGMTACHSTLLYGTLPTIIFTAWASVSGRLPGTKGGKENPEPENPGYGSQARRT